MNEFKQETIIRSHFSHPHPLKLITYQETLNLSSPIKCSGCMRNIPPAGMLYSCTTCEYFFLHKKCFEMPEKMTHPFHKKHELTLMAKPAYGDVLFVCNACRQRGDGFSYHCKRCSFDLHILCAVTPLSITHNSHTMHDLDLTCASNEKFSCDICTSLIGSRQWVYRCDKSCGFNAHLKCVAPTYDPVVPTPSLSEERTPQAASSTFAPTAPDSIVPPPSFEVNRSQNNDLAVFAVEQMIVDKSDAIAQAIQQMIVNNSNAIAQALILSSRSGYGGGSQDNRGLHFLIELICTLNNSGIIKGGDGQLSDFVNNSGGGGVSENRVYSRCNSCASTGVLPPVLQHQKFMETPPQEATTSDHLPPPGHDHMMMNNNIPFGFPAASPTQPPIGARAMNNGLALQRMISNSNNATAAQALLLSAYSSGSRGGGVLGGYRPELHLQLMRLMSNGGGGGGGGSQDNLLQELVNSSGGGGGGGGGTDFLQSLPGDGNGN